MKILIMNSLDERYGSTYRIRAFATELKKVNEKVSYYEKNIPFLLKLLDMPYRVLFGSFDVLIIQKFNPLTFLPILIGKLRRKYIIVDWDDWDTGLQKNPVVKLATWFCEKTLPLFPNLITSHNQELLSLVPKGTSKLFIEQGFDPDLFVKKNVKHSTKIRIGYMCTFTHGGTLDLNEILVAISKVNNPAIDFILIGGGSLLESFRQKAKQLGIQQIQFTGHVKHEQIPELLQSLDIGLVYMSDSLSNTRRVSFKVIEYLAAGLPVIGKVIGETEILFGSCIQKLAIHELSDYLQHLQTSTLPAKKDEGALLNNFIWSKVVKKLHLHLQSILR